MVENDTSIRSQVKDLRDETGLPFGIADMGGSPPRKYPTGVQWTVNGMLSIDGWPIYEIDGCFLRCGKDVESYDIDSKNWKEDGNFSHIVIEQLKYNFSAYDKLVFFKTLNDGLQIPIRCSVIGKNQKLARRAGQKEALIETRGDGGLIIGPPTAGYEWLQGCWEEIPILTPEEREELRELLMDWNQEVPDEIIPKNRAMVAPNTDRPGDDWGSQVDFVAWMVGHGWAVDHVAGDVVYLRRPGKDSGTSASWNHAGLGRLYVWSSSTELPTERLLTPFATRAILEHGGDYAACAKDLKKQGYGTDNGAMIDQCTGAKDWPEVFATVKDSLTVASNVEFLELSMGLQSLGVKGVTEAKLRQARRTLQQGAETGWRAELERSATGKVTGDLKNLHLILTNDPKYSESFFYDEMAQEFTLRDQPMTDEIMGRLRTALGKSYGTFRKEDIIDVLHAITEPQERRFHPLKQQIESVEWDGIERLDMWLIAHCGVDDSQYSRIVGRRTLISAIARLYRPGCQCDTMLILEGAQGARKSSLIKSLSFGSVNDSKIDIRSKDGPLSIRGVWFVELAELEAFRGIAAEAIRSFLTVAVDRYRLPYGKFNSAFPRSCVFVGTTNDRQYLTDGTGNRRFWPVKTGMIDLAGVEENRGQLWAEALHAYRSGERWWIDEDQAEAELFRSEQSDRVIHDEREELLDDLLARREAVSSVEVWTEGLHGEAQKFGRREQMEVSRIMQGLGWEQRRTLIDGEQRRVWEQKS
jgi:predicted P-loop ATPase